VATPVIWHLEISHYNEKARWALDHKGVPHVLKAVTPGFQEFRARRLRAGRTSPILEVDGRAIGDSTAIIAEIERRWPDPPLYPSEPEERLRALDIEDWFDEAVGHDLRRVVFNDLGPGSDYFLDALYGRDHPRRRMFGRMSPLLGLVIRTRFKIRPPHVERSRERVREAFDRIEAEKGPTGYLVGDSFSVADLTAAAIMSPLVMPPEFPFIKLGPEERSPAFKEHRDSLSEHPGFQWVLDMYARHRGASAQVPAATAA
jgi:glutathione S-transferase